MRRRLLDAAVSILVALTWLTVLAVAVGAVLLLDRTVCSRRADRLDVRWRYDVPGGCFYRIDGRWVPSGSYVIPSDR